MKRTRRRTRTTRTRTRTRTRRMVRTSKLTLGDTVAIPEGKNMKLDRLCVSGKSGPHKHILFGG